MQYLQMQYLAIALGAIQFVGCLFWLSQIVRVLTTDVDFFEDHKHKLLWFIVVIFVPFIGAVWYAVWLHQTVAQRSQKKKDEAIQRIAAAYRATEAPEAESTAAADR